MNKEQKALAKSTVKSFVAILIGLFVANGADVLSVNTEDLRTWVAVALATVLPPIVSYLDPTDARYGIGSKTGE